MTKILLRSYVYCDTCCSSNSKDGANGKLKTFMTSSEKILLFDRIKVYVWQ